ncbi:hypothetical protein [Photobacterium kishitanii]|uniref:H-NS family histone-like protein n=1 Tax=Photobacterium kishitanii TaxID=318456 RepID=UPI0004325A7C|nr:hypothetical protein [Photobacterium kishitanii]CEO42150.1 hypothetical protein PPBDW_p0002 [Photobacterium kishitanii]
MTTQNNNNIKEIITAGILLKIRTTKKFVANYSSSDVEIMINNLLSVQDKIIQQEAKNIENEKARVKKYEQAIAALSEQGLSLSDLNKYAKKTQTKRK